MEPIELEEVHKSPWNYILYRGGERYFIEVVCGSVGLYARSVELSAEEIEAYRIEGTRSIDALATRILNTPHSAPSEYWERLVNDLHQWPVRNRK